MAFVARSLAFGRERTSADSRADERLLSVVWARIIGGGGEGGGGGGDKEAVMKNVGDGGRKQRRAAVTR